jgi:hypothetical protein
LQKLPWRREANSGDRFGLLSAVVPIARVEVSEIFHRKDRRSEGLMAAAPFGAQRSGRPASGSATPISRPSVLLTFL